MAKLSLKFEKTELKQIALTADIVTLGRLPDNDIQVDNPAVSGHHAKIFWDGEYFIVEDNSSLNGTYINSNRVSRQLLKDGDIIVIGKHTVTFIDDGQEVLPKTTSAVARPLPRMDATMVLDTKMARDMIAQTAAKPRTGTAAEGSAAGASDSDQTRLTTAHMGAVLVVISGKTDQKQYALLSKYSVIGKSDMASVKLKGWFAPKVAAAITRRDNKYFIAPSDHKQKVRVNNELIAGQRELAVGDMIEVAKVKMKFNFSD